RDKSRLLPNHRPQWRPGQAERALACGIANDFQELTSSGRGCANHHKHKTCLAAGIETEGLTMLKRSTLKWLFCILVLLLAGTAMAQTTYTDNFRGAEAQLDWLALGAACLTAGAKDKPHDQEEPDPTIYSCSSKDVEISAGTDAVGQGALQLTPSIKWQAGAILSNFTFPMSQGLDVTFTTYTYGGNKGGTAKIGADGIAFFLTDGTIKEPPSDTGGTGGALRYSCSITHNP